MIEVREATIEDAEFVGANLREADRQEGMISTGKDPVQVVVDSLKASAQSYTVVNSRTGNPCAIFGATPDQNYTNLGIAWMLCTPEVSRVSKAIIESAREWIEYLSQDYPNGLQALAWSGNHLHIRWCRRFGFIEAGRIHHNGHIFIHLYRSNIRV